LEVFVAEKICNILPVCLSPNLFRSAKYQILLSPVLEISINGGAYQDISIQLHHLDLVQGLRLILETTMQLKILLMELYLKYPLTAAPIRISLLRVVHLQRVDIMEL